MELIERAGYLAALHEKYQQIEEGEGHCVFVSGEAGIGKTSLVKAFCHQLKASSAIYQGTCDALFTPRPLAPLYDILLQMRQDLPESSGEIADRARFFTKFYQELGRRQETVLIVFEDIHWADEATLDFIKFLGRRIAQLPCLFILTYRDDEIDARHPLRNILGQLNPDTFSRMQLQPLSLHAVNRMAGEKGYSGRDVYEITGGNPFYVTEILASYSPGIPDNIKDSILSVHNRQDEKTKQIWDVLSIFPAGFDFRYLEKMDSGSSANVTRSLDSKILVLRDGLLFFKHELYRRTIEASLSPLTRICYNKKILDNFREIFEQNQEIEKLLHHAKEAHEFELVLEYLPRAAKKAAGLGAHIEAARLYKSAIGYYKGDDLDTLIGFYESYAYEGYLINQIKEAIAYTELAMECWKKKNDLEKIGNSLRFLSRLWWFDGNRKQAESFAWQAIEVLERQTGQKAKAMAYSNMAQLKMLEDSVAECVLWGEKAIAISRELKDDEILSHALNNVGSVQMKVRSLKTGVGLMQQALDLALKNSFHEHAARAYTNLVCNWIVLKEYGPAKEALDAGVKYCMERELDSWKIYMLSLGARMKLEKGLWNEASHEAATLLKIPILAAVTRTITLTVQATVKIRRGEPDGLSLMLDAKAEAFATMELQRVLPALSALLEYEWITGKSCLQTEDIGQAIAMAVDSEDIIKVSEFAFWLKMAGRKPPPLKETYAGYQLSTVAGAQKAAACWAKKGCPYEQALALYAGSDDDKKLAVTLAQGLGAQAVYERMSAEMRAAGIKNIPRGIRKSTQSNPAQLTGRELEVLRLLNQGKQNKEIAAGLFISAKTVDHHISAILSKLEVNTRTKAVQEAIRLEIIK